MKTTLFAAASLLAASSSAMGETSPLQVVGTGDGMELVRLVGAAYTADHPERVVLVPPSIGSGGGIAAVGSGKALLARVARPLKSTEEETGLRAKSIFRLPTAIYVHPDLAVKAVTYDQLQQIYEGRLTNWAQMGGPDLPVKVVRREDTDSSLAVLRNSMPGWRDIVFTERSKIAMTTQDAVETVRNTKGAIGFGPFSRPLELAVKILAVEGRYPTQNTYPSAVTISFVWRRDNVPASVQSFLDFGLSDKAQALLKSHGALPVIH